MMDGDEAVGKVSKESNREGINGRNDSDFGYLALGCSNRSFEMTGTAVECIDSFALKYPFLYTSAFHIFVIG